MTGKSVKTIRILLSLALVAALAAATGTLCGAAADEARPKLAEPFAADGESGPLYSSERYIQRAPAAPGATWTVPGDYATIQAAIDAATAGDIISVAAGTYAEAILIDGKDLTLTGAGAGSSIITGTSAQTQYIVRITNGAIVDFSGFTVDGTGIERQYGIYADAGSSGDIHDNVVKNVIWPGAGGIAIRRQECHIDVTNNEVYGFGRIGIYTRDDVIGNTDTGVISGNTVTGLAGTDPDRLSYGISVYSGNPTVDGNEIRDCLSGANEAAWASSGIDVWTGSTSALTNNDFYNCQVGILSNSASPAISGNTFTDIVDDNVRLDYFVKGNPTPHWAEYYNTVQEAIDAIPVTTYPAIVWIGVYSGGGTYAEALNVNKQCHIWGYSRATTLLDVDGLAVNNAGVYVAADDVGIGSVTVESDNAVSLPRYGVKFGDNDGCYLYDAEIRNVYRTGMDALGATNLYVGDVVSKDNGGNGLQLCDCVDVTFENVTTSGNAWGGVGIFTWGQYTPIGVSGVVFTGTNSFGESASGVAGIYLEEGNYGTPSSPYPITFSTDPLDGADVTLQLADVTHMLTGESDNDNNYYVFYATLADAQTAASYAGGHLIGGRYITELAGTNLYVPATLGSVNAAAAAAKSGDTVHIDAGTFEEQVEITSDIVLQGAGAGSTEILSPDALTLYFGTNYPIVYVHDTDDAEIRDLTVNGAGKGNANYRFVGIGFSNAGGGVYDCDILDVRDTPFSGAQHGVALYAYNTDTTARTIDVHGCTFAGFQKNAMALNASDTNPLTVDVVGNTITGAGPTDVTAQNGVQVWAPAGGGTVDGNSITGIGYDNTAAATKYVASSVLSYWTPLTISGNTISNTHVGVYQYDASASITGNDVAIEKIGVSAYGILGCDPPKAVPSPVTEGEGPLGASRPLLGAPLATLALDISGNTVAFSGTDNSATYGIELDAGFGPDDIDADVNGNGVSGFEVGIEVWACQSSCDTGVFTAVDAHDNNLAGNDYGVRSNADYIDTDATGNWWGDATGPYHPTLNPGGLGSEVSDHVIFDPYLNDPNLLSVEPDYVVTNCTTPTTVDLYFDQAGLGDEVRGVDVTFQVDPAVATVSSITEGTYLSSIGSTQFYTLDNGGGSWTASMAILGGTTGATGDGVLLSLELTPVAEGLSTIEITDLKVRDVDNVPIDAGISDGEIRVDCTPPTMEAIAEAEGGWYNTAPVFSNFGFDDDINLDIAEYQIDAGGWVTIFGGIDAAEYNDDGWALPGFAALAEGSHTVYFRVKDDAGNWNGEGTPDTYSWQFNKDTVPPDPPTDFLAMPGHDQVHLTWTNPTGDATLAGVEIRRVGWTDYPEYGTPGDPAPDYPADETVGDLVTQTALEAYDDASMTVRDIYYFSAFSYDLAGNFSAYDAGASDRSTSYWLGDVHGPYDGLVDFNDLTVFSNTFGEADGGAGWDNECDFGPTDDWSRFGIPLPDNMIDFEDLMIFSMNYGNVTPLMMDGESDLAAEQLDELIGFDIRPVETENGTVYSIVMTSDASTLKGARIVLGVPGGSVTVTRGGMLERRGDVFFGTIDRFEGAEICFAALGTGVALTGSGEIARLRVEADADVALTLEEIGLRDVGNAGFELETGDDGGVPVVPAETALRQNFPNPFNPATTVAFDLSRSANVSVRIYDVSGRTVRVLVDRTMTAGRHEIGWDGRNSSGAQVPSGIYFCAMKTGDYTATRKMILLR